MFVQLSKDLVKCKGQKNPKIYEHVAVLFLMVKEDSYNKDTEGFFCNFFNCRKLSKLVLPT